MNATPSSAARPAVSKAPAETSPGATERLAQFTSRLGYADLPGATVEYTRMLLLDGIGCLLAGTRGAPGQMAARMIKALRSGNEGQATVVIDGSSASARDAAFVNGITLYSVGVNDIHRGSVSHPGGCIVPVVLSIGEWLKAPGTDLIVGMVVGYELMGRLGHAMIPSHWARGFHPTGTFGPFGAAAAASRMLRLDAGQTTWALGIAGSQAAGNKAFQADGSLTMIYHAGRSAQNGVEAALLAREGFSGPQAVLEDAHGFVAAGADDYRLPALTADLGEKLEIDATSFRPFYGCTLTIAASGATATLMARHASRRVEDVAAITVMCHPSAIREINDPDPRTLLSARLSMQFNVALVVDRRDVFVGDTTDQDLWNQRIRGLFPVISLEADSAMSLWGSAVTVRFKDGTTDRAEIRLPKGDPENPMTWDDTVTKFIKLTEPLAAPDAIRHIVDLVHAIEKTDGATLVRAIVTAARGARE